MHAERPAWERLPNAAHIAWVLADVRRRPEVWSSVRRTACEDDPDAAWISARTAARSAGREDSWLASWGATIGCGLNTANDLAQDAAAALVAWDDSSLLLTMPVDAVKTLAAAGHHPAVLLLPAVIVRNTP